MKTRYQLCLFRYFDILNFWHQFAQLCESTRNQNRRSLLIAARKFWQELTSVLRIGEKGPRDRFGELTICLKSRLSRTPTEFRRENVQS